jgi:hypothetical protein
MPAERQRLKVRAAQEQQPCSTLYVCTGGASAAVEQGHLSEYIARPQRRDVQFTASGLSQRDGDFALDDDVQPIGGLALAP